MWDKKGVVKDCATRNEGFILRFLTSNDETMPPKFWNEMVLNLEIFHIPIDNLKCTRTAQK